MKRMTYKSAGVDVKKGDAFVDALKKMLRGRKDPNVVAGIGGFAAAYRIPVKKGRVPLMVSGTDSVGTKIKIAFMTGKHDTVGIDCVAMCANDVAVQGARPIFFLDYLATSGIPLRAMKEIMKGVITGCDQAGCSLIGGENCELPGLYRKGEYDLAGFCVGEMLENEMLPRPSIRPGDAIIGIGSTGLHSNGYSLAIKVLIETRRLPLGKENPMLGCTLASEMLRPTRIYARTIQKLLRAVPALGFAHITGGGLPGNVPRILPKGCGAELRRGTWAVPPIFSLIEKEGRIAPPEMLRTFNMGLGLVAVVRKIHVDEALKCLLDAGERAQVVGKVIAGSGFHLK